MTPRNSLVLLLVSALALIAPAPARADGAAAPRSRCTVASADPPGEGEARRPPPAGEGLGDAPEAWARSGARLYDRGDFDGAAAAWLGAVERYATADDAAKEADALVHLALAYQALGQLERTFTSLERASGRANEAGRGQGAVLAALGEAYLALGALEQADAALARALGVATSGQDPALTAVVLNAQGSVRSAQGEYADAAALYRQSADAASKADDRALAASARANAARASLHAEEPDELLADAAPAVEAALALPDSADKARLLVHLGRTYQHLSQRPDADPTGERALAAAQMFAAGAQAGERIGDARTASFGWGFLGQLYERDGRTDEALELTRRALFAAQSAAAPEAQYLWQWQLGRLWRAAGQPDAAIEAYRSATQTLAALRGQRPVVGSEEGFDAAIRPVYFGLVDLLLQRAAGSTEPSEHDALVREARDTVEGLKVAELRDYFEDECLVDQPERAPDSIPGTVVIYPIALDDRIELIVSSPSGLRSIVVPVGVEQLNREVRAMRSLLERLTTRQYRAHAEQLYDWLVRPVERELSEESFETLVFVQGGALRTIPPAALYNRETKQFLVERYPLAVTPGLTLTDPRAIRPERVRLLLAGLTKSVQGYPALEAVATEIAGVQESFREAGPTLVDETFLAQRFEDEMQSEAFGIVHIASHGEFSGDSAESFVLTFDGRLSIDRLSQLAGLSAYRDEPLELLTLSACQTAAGDDRAALGLAGVAVQSGARSALATLWYISDEASSELVTQFYRELRKPGVSRAEALRRAQVRFIDDPSFRHPGYWAPFLLIGSWL